FVSILKILFNILIFLENALQRSRGMLSWQFLSDVKGTVRTKETARECCNILFKKTAMQYDRVLYLVPSFFLSSELFN
ncbi:hypothetical protein ACE1ET_20645, partial [Saccharicrinis sp. FJH62]|uniref:hypothetical protein n=1 Tax=Saccharicrinis sp. FJH62 TaxID=3344657 RepID=UPI0035D51B7E